MSFVIGPDKRPVIDKAVAASLRYGIRVEKLLATGDQVQSVSLSAQSGITAADPDFDGAVISARISGGTVGSTGSATLRWVTTGGDTDERSIDFNVVAR